MRLVFCGTPRFAVPALQEMLRAGHSVDLVITRPDRAAGRDRALSPPPVKEFAADLGLPISQPERIQNNPELRARLEAIAPEAIVVVAYGKIIPRWMIDLPRWGNLNLHASLLPKYRGAAPIQWAIANGELTTGTTTMRIDEGLDTGEILLQRETAIAPGQTAEDLSPLLAASGAVLMRETLEGLVSGSIQPVPQDDSASSLAPLLRREDALVDFSQAPGRIYNRWRGFQPWPGAYTFFRGKKLILHRILPAEDRRAAGMPGEIAVERGRMLAAAGGGGWIELLEVQMAAKSRLPAREFLRGMSPRPGERLGQAG